MKKRKDYKKVFENFDFQKLARWTDARLEKSIGDERIVRNSLKVYSVRKNAKASILDQKEFVTFKKYIETFTGGKILYGKIKSIKNIPVKTLLSDAFSKDLKKRGFTFVGSTIIYAYLQSTGFVNDHEGKCFRSKELKISA